jgi:AraC-like DNA-binding protein
MHQPAHESVHQRYEELPLHRHALAYAALVLDGCYEERSIDGCFRCVAGDLVIHPPHHAHRNAFPESDATIFNFPVAIDNPAEYVVLKVANHDALERIARDNPFAAGDAVLEEAACRRKQLPTPAWMTEMADILLRDTQTGRRTNIAALAVDLSVSPQHASRAFSETFGASPARFRTEHRLRRALSLLGTGVPPSRAAFESGFADQSHFIRAMKQIFGQTPNQWKHSRAEC